ncbi:MAG: hypothetical protein M3066_00990 [Actinomycetota bacterium]|nr:hypothetical protein [Actinomycetota bacterium]
MVRRARAKRALKATTTRATVDEALRRVADAGEHAADDRARMQLESLARLGDYVDLEVLASGEMWR